MFGDDPKEYFTVSVKQANVREPETFLFKVSSRATLMQTKEAIYDYCDKHHLVVLFIDQISEEYYNKHSNCITLVIK